MVAVINLTLVPASIALNGYGTARSLDENSSFESPATQSLPFENARSVTDSVRGLRRPVALATGAFGSSTFWNFRFCSATMSIFPAPSTRKSAGAALAPWPRITET